MKMSNLVKITIASIVMLSSTNPAFAARGGNKGGGNEGPGPDDPVFMIGSPDPYIPEVESHSLDLGGQIVFYGQMDISRFTGTWDSGGDCFNDGLLDGVIVMYPQSKSNPLTVELIFWYPALLESGDSVTHLLTMQGMFDEPDNWPPSTNDPVTTVTLNYWEFAAENKKAQRKDCSGSSDFPAGPWIVTVERL